MSTKLPHFQAGLQVQVVISSQDHMVALKYIFYRFTALFVRQCEANHSIHGGGGGGGGPQGYTPHPSPTHTYIDTHTKKLQTNRMPG